MSSHSILIVEDHLIIRKKLQAVLEANGFIVYICNNGKEGLFLVDKYLPDLVITDIVMPIMDGYTFMLRMRQDQRFDSIPIVILTALEGADDRIKGLQAGAVDFIVKPFSVKELLFKVRNILNIKKAAQSALIDKRSPFQKKFDAFLQTNLDQNHKLDFIANELQMSRSSLLRNSKKFLHSSPYQYITQKRLQTAKKQMEAGYFQLSEIAYKMGFSSPSHFTASFRKAFGITPSQYINELNKAKLN